MTPDTGPGTFRFGEFELDEPAGELRRSGRRVKLQPQPFKLLGLLARRAGSLVTRDEIRRELWPEGTFVDFDQAVNFSIKQIRDVLHDDAERPLYIETVPRRGYRFIAPVDDGTPAPEPVTRKSGGTTIQIHLQKALWANIAELRVAQARRRRYTWMAIVLGIVVVIGIALMLILAR